MCLICLFAEVTNFHLNYIDIDTKVVLFNFKRRGSFYTRLKFEFSLIYFNLLSMHMQRNLMKCISSLAQYFEPGK